MASLCAVVILVIRNPLVVDLSSNAAVTAGVAVPIPTWAFAPMASSTSSVGRILLM